MIINKITIGFVIQQFDTEQGKFTSQHFVAGDEVSYEDGLGNEAQDEMPTPEPYLPFEMKQPEDINSCNPIPFQQESHE